MGRSRTATARLLAPAAARAAAAPPQPQRDDRNLALEACRGIAATMVLLYHLAAFTQWPSSFPPRLILSNGDAGVTLFFVLSGFLLWRPFAAGIDARERTWISARFLRNRALRILPAYWVALTVVLVAGAGLGVASIRQYLLLQNFSRDTLFTGISPAWSLALEAVFYLALPMLGAVGVWWARRSGSTTRVQAGVIAGWMAVSLAFKGAAWLVWSTPASDAYVYFSFPAKMHLFGFGMVLAVWACRRDVPGPVAAGRPWLAPVTGALILLAAVQSRYSSDASQLWFDTVCGVGFALLVYPLIFRSAGRAPVRRTLERAPLVWLGTISYSLYLWHHPLLGWLGDRGLLRPSMGALAANVAIALAVCIPAAWLSYGLVEYPFLKMRQGWVAARRVRAAGAPAPDAEPAVAEAAPR